MRVSYSALSSFNQCPLKYKWQFVDRIKVPSTPDQFFGSLIHSVLEFALKNGELLPLEKSLEYYKNNWKSEIFNNKKCEAPYRSKGSGTGNNNEHFNNGLEMIKNFYLSYKPDQVTILNTEKFFEIYWQDHKIVGKIDRIDKLPSGEIEIIDYKTNKKLPNEDDFKYDWQLPLYAWASQTMFCDNMSLRGAYPDSATRQSQNDSKIASQKPHNDNNITIQQYNNEAIESCPPIKLTFYYLRYNKQINPPNAKTLEELQKYILDTIYKIQNSKFEAQASNLCGWCEYLHMCDKGQEFISNRAVSNKVISNRAIDIKSNEKLKVKNDNSIVNNNEINKSKILNLKSKITISSNQQSLF